MRAFIAIQLPPGIKDALAGLQRKLKTKEIQISWVKPQNLHLTLKFLGNIQPVKLIEIEATLEGIIKNSAGFRIQLETLGAFPSVRAGRIIWVGARRVAPELKTLAGLIETGLEKTGIPKEKRAFSAHITIGRIKRIPPGFNLQDIFDKAGNLPGALGWELNCQKVVLYESRLSPGGADYREIKEFNFKIK